MGRTVDGVLCQYGALPFSITEDGEVRVLLVTTRGRGEWIIPKGWPIRNLSGGATAAREAYEEAGLLGSVIGEDPIGSYRYQKQRTSRRTAIHEVSVFLFAVKRQLRKWPEKPDRLTRWVTPTEAPALVSQAGLSDLLHNSTRDLLALAPQMLALRTEGPGNTQSSRRVFEGVWRGFPVGP
jgi:8-oxo-dGTP pyrophosphatase MutT (NUDIX family)